MLSLWLLSFLFSYPVYNNALYVSSTAQTMIDGNTGRTDHGVLKRFVAQPTQGWEVNDILEAAEAANADVWQVGHSHVDIFSQNDFQSPLNDAKLLLQSQSQIPNTHASQPPVRLSPGSWDLSSLANTTYHSSYHPLYEIEEFMQEMAEQYPGFVQLVNLGHSAEGREMFAMRLSKDKELSDRKGAAAGSAKKLGFVVTGAQHAREWIATSTALYLAHALVASASEPHTLSSLLDYYEFHIVPIPNPDGYVYTWETDRYWYKNRQILGPNEKCIGLDMNRNWGYKWKPRAQYPDFNVSSSARRPSEGTDPCSHWYPGHRPFESPEVNNIANYITTLPALKAYVDLRSYGQMLSIPYSFHCKKAPKDAEDLMEAALGAVSAIKQVHGTAFTSGSLCSMLYKAPGNVVDWMYARAGVKFSYSVFLRDTGTYGFSLPAEWIRPVGEETANMIQFLAGFISSRKP